MKLNLFGTKKKKDKFFLSLDIGTEAVKVLFSRKGADGKITILGAATQYFERYGVFDGRDFETDVIKKSVSKAIEQAYQSFVLSPKRKGAKIKKLNLKKLPVLVSLSSNILKGRIIWQFFKRGKTTRLKISKDEEKNIYQQCFKKSQKEISQQFNKEFGILPEDIKWVTLKVLEVKIDGYSVPKLQGYEGEDLRFKILVVFLPKYYFENIKRIFKNLQLNIFKIVHIAENLPILSEDKTRNAIFLDVGGQITQIFLVKAGILQQINEFEIGGRIFSQKLSETLGLDEESARVLKEKYANKFLSPESEQRIKEIFSEEKRIWYDSLMSKIKKINPKKLFSSTIFSSLNLNESNSDSPQSLVERLDQTGNKPRRPSPFDKRGCPKRDSALAKLVPVWLFGGGSLLPEIQEALTEAELIRPKSLKNIKDATKGLKSPQYIPSLLISYYGEEIF